MSRNALTIRIVLLILVVTGHGRQFGSDCRMHSQWTAREALTVLCKKLLWRLETDACGQGRAVAIRLYSRTGLAGKRWSGGARFVSLQAAADGRRAERPAKLSSAFNGTRADAPDS
jgi:hypothetical protein